MKTRDEFINAYRHRLGGLVLDALEYRQGPALSLFVRTILRRIDEELATIYATELSQPLPEKPTLAKETIREDNRPRPAGTLSR